MEVDRGTGDVELQVDLVTTFLGLVASEYPTHDTQFVHRITGRRWLELLDHAGKAIGITVRVPSPLTGADGGRRANNAAEPSLARAIQRLREARLALRDGDISNFIKLCRQVLENTALLDRPDDADPVRKKTPKTRTQRERWSALHHDLFSLASGASHDDAVASVEPRVRAGPSVRSMSPRR